MLFVEKIQAGQVEEAPFLEVPTEASALAAFLVDAFLQGRAGVPVGALHPVVKEYLAQEASYRAASQVALCQEEEQVGKHQEAASLRDQSTKIKLMQKTFIVPKITLPGIIFAE